MKRLLLLGLAVLPILPAQVVKTAATINPIDQQLAKAKITRVTLTGLERRFDSMLAHIGSLNEPIDPLGATRGVQIEDFGVVFSAELGLLLTPTISPFMPKITPEMVTRVHQRKLERLPALRASMREMMQAAATALVHVAENQALVLVVRLDYLSWENATGLPTQIMMRADRRSALRGEFKEESQ